MGDRKFDTAALVKLVRVESESAALIGWLGEMPDDALVSSALAEAELPRALRRSQPAALGLSGWPAGVHDLPSGPAARLSSRPDVSTEGQGRSTVTSKRAVLAGAAMAGGAVIAAALIATAAPTVFVAGGGGGGGAFGRAGEVLLASSGIGGTGAGLSDLESLVVIGGSSTGTSGA